MSDATQNLSHGQRKKPRPLILALNVGSTSVKLALFSGESQLAEATRALPTGARGKRIASVLGACDSFLADHGHSIRTINAVAARGGILRPLAGGTYIINATMLSDLRSSRYGRHASNLSALAAHEIAGNSGIPAYVVDPPTVDELSPESRLTGTPLIRRRSIFHALSQRAAARRAAADAGVEYDRSRLIVAHLGGGISVGAHVNGRVVDVTNALDGDGPMAPERSGSLPAADMARLCFSGEHSESDIARMIAGDGGVFAHLGTRDMAHVAAMAADGDPRAALVMRSMAASIAKSVGAMAAQLDGQVDAVAITGGLAACESLLRILKPKIAFIGRLFVYPENLEMAALAHGVLRVLLGEEKELTY
jgi:butyrate kinase